MRPADLLRLIALAAIWGASFLFVRLAVPALGAAWLTELRVALASVAMVLLVRASGLRFEPRRHWRHYLVMGGLNTALPWALYAYSGNYIGASTMAILNAATPWFAAVCGAIWLGERFSARKAAGLVLGLVGVALVVGLGPIEANANVVLASLACIAATACYALCGTYMKKRVTGVSPLVMAAGSLVVASVAVLPGLPGPLPVQALLAWPVAVAVLGISLLCSALAYVLYFRLIANVGPTKSLTVTFLIPVFGVLWGAVFLGEPIGASTLVGGGVILLSTALVLEIGRGGRARYNSLLSKRGKPEPP